MRLGKIFSIISVITLLTAAGIFAYMLFRDTISPDIDLAPSPSIVSALQRFNIQAQDRQSGIAELSITLIQNDREREILHEEYPTIPERVYEKFSIENIGLEEGPFEVHVSARDGSYRGFGKGNRANQAAKYLLDSRAPEITIKGAPPEMRQGEAGVVRFRLSEFAVKSGVWVGKRFFSAFLQKSGDYACVFAFPFYLPPEGFNLAIYAEDRVGNQSLIPLSIVPLPENFRTRDIDISSTFLEKSLPQFNDVVPTNLPPVDRFLVVNRDLRSRSSQLLVRLGKETSPYALSSGVFLKLPQAITTGLFADQRRYLFKGQVIDEQFHQGIDLASTQHAEIPAANSGRVIFSDKLSIYGNMVLIDHGLGLQTLYGHLSESLVSPGEVVEKGQIIGRTGNTGLSGGDHLHFGVLVSGVPVNPAQWWDREWVDANVTSRLE